MRRLELDAKVAKAQVDQFLMVEERERIDYELAIEELARRSIRAPWPGIVIRVDIEEGENCEPRQPLLTLVDVSRSYLVINVQAARSRQLKVGQTLQVEIHPAPSTPLIAGQVSYVSPVVDAGSGLGEVRVLFPNPGGRVLPGTVARLTLPALKP